MKTLQILNVELFQTPRSPPGSPWPMPQSWSPTDEVLTFNQSDFRFMSQIQCDVISSAIERYTAFMTLTDDARPANDLQVVQELRIDVTGSDECEGAYPFDGMDESCKKLK